MRVFVAFTLICLLAPFAADAQQKPRHVYTWVDDEGVRHYGNAIPPEFADKPKEVLNDQGVTIAELEGKKTAEQLAAEARKVQLEQEQELQRRADQSLLLTYQSVEEIVMHRDRRVELFQAQARVTELYLRNLTRRLDQLKKEAGRFKPYSSNTDAPMIDPSLVEDMKETEAAIDRHENNLSEFRNRESDIIQRFDKNIERFKYLRGVVDDPQTRLDEESLAQAVPE